MLSFITLFSFCETFFSHLRWVVYIIVTSLSWYSIGWPNITSPFFLQPLAYFGTCWFCNLWCTKEWSYTSSGSLADLALKWMHLQIFFHQFTSLTVHYFYVILDSRKVSSIWGFCFAKIWTKTRYSGCGEGRDTLTAYHFLILLWIFFSFFTKICYCLVSFTL